MVPPRLPVVVVEHYDGHGPVEEVPADGGGEGALAHLVERERRPVDAAERHVAAPAVLPAARDRLGGAEGHLVARRPDDGEVRGAAASRRAVSAAGAVPLPVGGDHLVQHAVAALGHRLPQTVDAQQRRAGERAAEGADADLAAAAGSAGAPPSTSVPGEQLAGARGRRAPARRASWRGARRAGRASGGRAPSAPR